MIQTITILTAFGAGFLSFFAPCILPLIPPYFAWLLGTTVDKIKGKKLRLALFLQGLYLTLGFSIVFIILGASASKLGHLFLQYRLPVQKIGGLLIILFGLKFLGILKILEIQKYDFVKKAFSKLNKKTGSFVVGLIFAAAWTACFSPILGSILVLASFQETLNSGVILLSSYSLGLAIPFLLTALFIEPITQRLGSLKKAGKWINLASGAILVILGFLLFTDNYYKIVSLLAGVSL